MRVTLAFIAVLAVVSVFERPSLEIHIADVQQYPQKERANEQPKVVAQMKEEPVKEEKKEVVMATAMKPISEPGGMPQPTKEPYRSAWKEGIATVFWVGEGAGSDNGFIHNSASAWDGTWEQSFGGLDDPSCREGYNPCGFVPKENPFYVALPFNDRDNAGAEKSEAARIPWYVEKSEKSILKNRWVEIRAQDVSCFGQWEDTGPFSDTDFAYVFGDTQTPVNTFGEKAGIDLSPALRDCLGVDGSAQVSWRHVDEALVVEGPWKKTITR